MPTKASNKFWNILQKKSEPRKEDSQKEPSQKAPPRDKEKKEKAVGSVLEERNFERQWKALVSLYSRLPSHPPLEKVEAQLHETLNLLQSTTLSQKLSDTFPDENLSELQQKSEEDYHKMYQVNRKRVQSMVALSPVELQQVIAEGLILFHINPEDHPPLGISVLMREEADSQPAVKEMEFPLFPQNSPCGIDRVDEFFHVGKNLPEGKQQLPAVELLEDHPELQQAWNKQYEYQIKAITAVGSLGGIAHKVDSNLDLQVIVGSEPDFLCAWNDADFFLAAMCTILQNVQQGFFHDYLSAEKQKSLGVYCRKKLHAHCVSELTEEELSNVEILFPSTFQKFMEDQTWKLFGQLNIKAQQQFFIKYAIIVLQELPELISYFKYLLVVFPFLRSIPKEQIQLRCFPYSPPKLSPEHVLKWLTKFYAEQHLGSQQVVQLKQKYAAKQNIEMEKINPAISHKLLLHHFQQNPRRYRILQGFLEFLASRQNYFKRQGFSQTFVLLQKKFDPQQANLKPAHLSQFSKKITKAFQQRMEELLFNFCDWSAVQKEGEMEVPLHIKVKHVERYLGYKYPQVETRIFHHFLRRQKQGKHVPFLALPESTEANGYLFNDVVLNTSLFLAGTMPLPFILPESIRKWARAEIYPKSSWPFINDQGKTFFLNQISDWGPSQLSMQEIYSHSLPIFLHESLKIHRRRLLHGLWSCFWVEMLCCRIDEPASTSVSDLLQHPEKRYFLKQAPDHEWSMIFVQMEEEYPFLLYDPAWIKFTEMLFRFDNEEIRNHIIFVFSQYIRITDIVDGSSQTFAPLRKPSDPNWRNNALIRFYEEFFKEPQERMLLYLFAQGRDDIAHKVEERLKVIILESMNRLKNKLLEVEKTNAVAQLSRTLLAKGVEEKNVSAFQTRVNEHFQEKEREFFILGEDAFQPAGKNRSIEEETASDPQVQAMRDQDMAIAETLAADCKEMAIPLEKEALFSILLSSHIAVAGDPKECQVFHKLLLKSFNPLPTQVYEPVSKNLRVPRKNIRLRYNNRKRRWGFYTAISKHEAVMSGASGQQIADSEKLMFEMGIAEGLARCVFSGFIGIDSWNLTNFIKESTTETKKKQAISNMSSNALQELAFILHRFFAEDCFSPREILEDRRYVREVCVACNVNYLGCISLIIRDSFGDHYVVSYDMNKIRLGVPPHFQITSDISFPQFFLQLNNAEGRKLFMQKLYSLNIPFDEKHPPKFQVWVNYGDFALTASPNHYRIYIQGITDYLWPAEKIAGPDFLSPLVLDETFDKIGRAAIEKFKERER
ncbi:MAG: hypothetical protein HQM14_14570 [SAR324 cluster bacterium]|nr:hypothetical protein [SAR324 cluster bacterium]